MRQMYPIAISIQLPISLWYPVAQSMINRATNNTFLKDTPQPCTQWITLGKNHSFAKPVLALTTKSSQTIIQAHKAAQIKEKTPSFIQKNI